MLFCLVFISAMMAALGAPTATAPTLNSLVQSMFAVGDKDKDGMYSRSEAWASLLNLDSDGDKKISRSEYIHRWTSVASNMGIVASAIFNKFDFDQSGFLDQSDLDKGYALIDLDSNGQVSNSEFSSYMGTVLGGVLPSASSSPPTAGINNTVIQALVDTSFPQVDLNKDGYLSFDEEWADVKHYDLNGDNRVSKTEFMSIITKLAPGSEMWPDVFDGLDYNNDRYLGKQDIVKYFQLTDADQNGLVSKSEISTFFANFDQLLSSKTTSTDMIDFGFADSDANKDGFVTLDEEWTNMLHLDNNTDNKISLAEFLTMFAPYNVDMMGAAVMIFRKYDKDLNGYFEKPDIAAFFNDMDAKGEGKVSRNVYVTFVEKMFAAQGVDIMAASIALMPNAMQAADIKQHYSHTGRTSSCNATSTDVIDFGFAESDANKDGFVTLDEEWTNMLRLDNNTDNKISLAEFLIMFVAYKVDMIGAAVRVFLKYDKDMSGYFEKPDIAAFFNDMDANGDGKVSRNVYVTFIETMFAAQGVDIRAASIELSTAQVTNDFGFHDTDTNGDNLISLDEQWAGVLKLDTDGDQRVSKAEYLTRYDNLSPDIQAAAPKIFTQFDSDGNGFLDRSDVARGFPMVDTNGDSFLTVTEYVDFVTKLYASLGIDLTQIGNTSGFGPTDTNHDGKLSVDEQWTAALTLDTDGDKKISKAEYVASGPQSQQGILGNIFDRFDADKSGFLDRTDVVQGFAIVDTSGDGLLSMPEYQTFIANLYASLLGGVNSTSGVVDMSDFGFSLIDTNKDGQVTFDEEWAAITVYDTDGDNRISQAEYLKSFPPSLPSVGPKIFTKFDSDSNGFFEKVDIRKFVALVDTNGDGTMSSSEYSSFVGTLLTSLGVDVSQLLGTTPVPTQAG